MITIAILSILLLAVIGGIVLSYIPYIVLAIFAASVILLTIAVCKWFIK